MSQPADTFLDAAEIKGLTDKIRRSAQIKVLRAMCIEHKVRPNGSIAILRAHIAKVFDGNPDSTRKTIKTTDHNWDAI